MATEDNPNFEIPQSSDQSKNLQSSKGEMTSSDLVEEEGRKKEKTPGRDISVSSLLHLMGLPTASQVSLLEQKIDMLSSKLTAVTSKIDRFAGQLAQTADQLYLDRIDFQLADIRTVIKKLFPKAAASNESLESNEGGIQELQRNSMVLTSTDHEEKETNSST